MDVVNELERTVNINATIYNDPIDKTPVDERLIELAKRDGAAIMTNDFNLNKVATAEGIKVLNINDLVLALRSEYQAGGTAKIKITGKGQNRKQGVGYLPDGTMAVVENAGNKIGAEVEVEFVRLLQTPSGKMMFAKLSGARPKNRK
jgi:uncharacterized protein YacL